MIATMAGSGISADYPDAPHSIGEAVNFFSRRFPDDWQRIRSMPFEDAAREMRAVMAAAKKEG